MGLKDIASGIGKWVEEKSEDLKHREKLLQYKEQILEKLSTGQLKSLCDYYGKEPQSTEEPVFALYDEQPRKQKKFVPTRADYLDAASNGIAAQDIIDWCRERRIHEIDALVEGRTAYKKKQHINDRGNKVLDTEIESEPAREIVGGSSAERIIQEPEKPKLAKSTASDLIERIEKMPSRRFNDENDAKYFLLAKLEEWFPNRVTPEGRRGEVDLLVDDKIGVEIKNFRKHNTAQMQRLIGQTRLYAKNYDAYIVVLFDGKEEQRQQLLRENEDRNNIFVILK